MAQPDSLEFERFKVQDGLLNSVVSVLWRQSDGFLWAGGPGGIAKYEGARIRPFTNESSHKLPDPQVLSISGLGYKKDGFWVATRHGGIAFYDPVKQTFIRQDSTQLGALPSHVSTVHVGPDGTVWAGTGGEGLYRLLPYDDRESSSSWAFEHMPSSSLQSDSILTLLTPNSTPGYLWVGTSRGLALLDASSQQWLSYMETPGDLKLLWEEAVTALEEYQGTIWAGTANGQLVACNPTTGSINHIDIGLGAEADISSIASSNQWPGVLWIGTRGKGLIAYNTLSGEIIRYTYNYEDDTSLSHSDVLDVIEDDQGIIWVGTRGGLNKSYFHKPYFEAILSKSAPGVQEHPSDIYTVYEPPSDRGTVWYSTARGPVYSFKLGSDPIIPAFNDPMRLDYVVDMLEDQSGRFWFGGRYSDLYLLKRAERDVISYPITNGFDTVVHQIYEMPSRPGILWLATKGHGLIAFDAENKDVLAHYTTTSQEPLSSNDIIYIYEDPAHAELLWLGTISGGLVRLDTKINSIQIYHDDSSDACPPDDILSISSDPDEGLWLGGYTTGLTYFNPGTNACMTYDLRDGVPGLDIGALFFDSYDRLWMTSNGGLAVMDRETRSIIPFGIEDGLQSSTFHYQAFHQNELGMVFIGGDKGLNVFHPDSIYFDVNPANTDVTRIEVNGEVQKVSGDDFSSALYLASLKPDQNNVKFEFASQNLTLPERNLYRIRLREESLNSEFEWRVIGNKMDQHYERLSDGRYIFEVQSTNADSYWGEQTAQVHFTIQPHIWKTWWFSFLVALASISLVGIVYQYRIIQLRRIGHTRNQIADDLHDDIGSKMSSIAIRLDMASRDKDLEVGKQSQLAELTETVRDLVGDLRDVVWIVDAENDRMKTMVGRMEQAAYMMLKGRRYKFQITPDLPDYIISMERRRHLYLLYKEALHNIIKHSEAKNVEISISVSDGLMRMQIIDDGIGFDPNTGSEGRGMKTMKRRSQKFEGQVQIESAIGKGTRVILEVPISKLALRIRN